MFLWNFSHIFQNIFVDISIILSSFPAVEKRTDPPAAAITDAGVHSDALAVAQSVITLPERSALGEISSVREALPGRLQLWVGGSCAQRLAAIDGVDFIATLAEFERRVVRLGYESAESM